MLMEFLGIDTTAEAILAVMLLFYTPFAVYQLYLMDYSLWMSDSKLFKEKEKL